MKKLIIIGYIFLLVPVYVLAQEETGKITIPEIKISGYMQGNYSSVYNDVQVSTDTFSLNRVRLIMNINLPHDIEGYVQGDVKSGSIKDAYISYTYAHWFAIRLGQQKIPVSSESIQSESKLDLIEYPQVIKELIMNLPGFRDTGVKIISEGPWWEGSVMVSNGSGENQNDENEHKALSGRMGIFNDSVYIGGSGYRSEKRLTANAADEKIIRFGAEVRIGSEEGFLKAEYLLGKDGNIKKSGWTITGDTGLPFVHPLLYRNIPLRVLIRFEQWDPDKKVNDDGESRVVFGLVYTLSEYVKFDINYTLVQEEVETQINNNRFNIQCQIKF